MPNGCGGELVGWGMNMGGCLTQRNQIMLYSGVFVFTTEWLWKRKKSWWPNDKVAATTCMEPKNVPRKIPVPALLPHYFGSTHKCLLDISFKLLFVSQFWKLTTVNLHYFISLKYDIWKSQFTQGYVGNLHVDTWHKELSTSQPYWVVEGWERRICH